MTHPGITAALCRMSRRKPEDLQPHLSLGSLGINSSFGLSALRSLVEAELRVKLPPLTASLRVEELYALADRLQATGSAAAVPVRPAPRTAPQGTSVNVTPGTALQLGLGLDMQEIDTLPDAADLRSDPFYAAHFSAEEIATALLRPDPRAHLCGIFCAKEAAKKSHPELLPLRMDELRVSHDDSGRPHLHLATAAVDGARFRFTLSITHTARTAAATCLVHWSEAQSNDRERSDG